MFLPSTSVFHASLVKRLKQDSIVNEWIVLEVSGCWLARQRSVTMTTVLSCFLGWFSMAGTFECIFWLCITIRALDTISTFVVVLLALWDAKRRLFVAVQTVKALVVCCLFIFQCWGALVLHDIAEHSRLVDETTMNSVLWHRYALLLAPIPANKWP